MRKFWAVVRREFVERVRSKWFWLSAVLGPLVVAAILIIPLRLAASGGAKRIAVVDGSTGAFGRRVADSLARGGAFRVVARQPTRTGLLDSLTREVGAKRLDGFLIVTDATVETGAAEYRASNVSSLRDIEELRRVLGLLAVNGRLERAGVDPGTVRRAQLRINLQTKKISGSRTTGESAAESFWLAYLMSMVLFVVIAVYGVNVMSSVLEEKTTRMVEVLVSSLAPFQLMFGKVVGVGAVSIFQFAIWAVGGRLVLTHRAALVGSLTAAEPQMAFQLPHVPASTAAILVAYFLGGFFLYSAMFAAVGAMASNEQEARQAQQPVMFLLMIAYLSVFALANSPGSTYAVALSLIPFTAPIAMPVRWAAGSLGARELVESLGLLALGIVVVTWIAARIYRVGILMTGKRPNLKELARWIRA
ncbi:MAG TPA: ABC transporter permease [Gemmatimonadales bacterium]|nr:ABC transporter permease [Gemmatimonadales bacterium]